MLDYADAKIRALVKFGAYQENANSVLVGQFGAWKTDPDNRSFTENEINLTMQVSEDATTELAEQFSGIGSLVAGHESEITVRESEQLMIWLQQTDHIEFPNAA